MHLLDYFDQVSVVNLDRRSDRWTAFQAGLPKDWPFGKPQRFAAVDGQLVKPPTWWLEGAAAWGCYRSHARILENCLLAGIESVLVLEDDAVFSDDFTTQVSVFLEQVPEDWEMLYLGGQHLDAVTIPPRQINRWVYQPYNVNRTHAFAVRGKVFMQRLYRHLHEWDDWEPGHHLDHHLGRLHQERTHRIYAPKHWLVGQAAGNSDIAGRDSKQRFWPAAEQLPRQDLENTPFVAVLGLHSSGSSCMAGILYHLGIHLGNKLGGFYGSDPNRSCGFEAIGLVQLCEDAIPFPSLKVRRSQEEIVRRLRRWINDRRYEALRKGTLAGGKYPQLCRLGDELRAVVGSQLRVVHIQRPVEESIASLAHRCPKRDPHRLAAHQRWLWDGKNELLAEIDPACKLEVDYSELLAQPRFIISQVIEFLGIEPSAGQIERAIAYVDPGRRHIDLGANPDVLETPTTA
jgi:GR25 family glycosyltransferase involved in LPS biosynthesis